LTFFDTNLTETAILLGCTRATLYNYLQRYPELQEYRREIVATLNDFAESTVKQALKARDMINDYLARGPIGHGL
jgi:hypothetical protein